MPTPTIDVKLVYKQVRRWITIEEAAVQTDEEMMQVIRENADDVFRLFEPDARIHAGGYIIDGPRNRGSELYHTYMVARDYRAVQHQTELKLTAMEGDGPAPTPPEGRGGQTKSASAGGSKNAVQGRSSEKNATHHDVSDRGAPALRVHDESQYSLGQEIGSGAPADSTLNDSSSLLRHGWRLKERGARKKVKSRRGPEETIHGDFQVPEFPEDIKIALETKGVPLTSAQRKVVIGKLYDQMAEIVRKDLKPEECEYTRVLDAFKAKYPMVEQAHKVTLPQGMEFRACQCPWKLALLRKFKYHRHKESRAERQAKAHMKSMLEPAPTATRKKSKGQQLTEHEKRLEPIRKKPLHEVQDQIRNPYKEVPLPDVNAMAEKLKVLPQCPVESQEWMEGWKKTRRARRYEVYHATKWSAALERWPALGKASILFEEVHLQTGVKLPDNPVEQFLERKGARCNVLMMMWDICHRKGPSAGAALCDRTRLVKIKGDILGNWILLSLPLFLKEGHTNGWVWHSYFPGNIGSPVVAAHIDEEGNIHHDRFQAYLGGEIVCPLEEQGMTLEAAFKALVSACYLGFYTYGSLCPVSFQILAELIFNFPVLNRDKRGDRYVRMAYRLLSEVELDDEERDHRMDVLEERAGLKYPDDDEAAQLYEPDSCTEEQRELAAEGRRKIIPIRTEREVSDHNEQREQVVQERTNTAISVRERNSNGDDDYSSCPEEPVQPSMRKRRLRRKRRRSAMRPESDDNSICDSPEELGELSSDSDVQGSTWRFSPGKEMGRSSSLSGSPLGRTEYDFGDDQRPLQSEIAGGGVDSPVGIINTDAQHTSTPYGTASPSWGHDEHSAQHMSTPYGGNDGHAPHHNIEDQEGVQSPVTPTNGVNGLLATPHGAPRKVAPLNVIDTYNNSCSPEKVNCMEPVSSHTQTDSVQLSNVLEETRTTLDSLSQECGQPLATEGLNHEGAQESGCCSQSAERSAPAPAPPKRARRNTTSEKNKKNNISDFELRSLRSSATSVGVKVLHPDATVTRSALNHCRKTKFTKFDVMNILR